MDQAERRRLYHAVWAWKRASAKMRGVAFNVDDAYEAAWATAYGDQFPKTVSGTYSQTGERATA